MLSSILRSDVAIKANIAIMRAFVQVRRYLLQMQQEENLESVNDLSEDVRGEIDNLYLAIAELSSRIEEKKKAPRPKIGFK